MKSQLINQLKLIFSQDTAAKFWMPPAEYREYEGPAPASLPHFQPVKLNAALVTDRYLIQSWTGSKNETLVTAIDVCGMCLAC